MAEDRLVPNGDDGGWSNSDFSVINEGIAGADGVRSNDGDLGTQVAEGGILILDLTSTVIVDADTVTRIAIDIRAESDKFSTSSDLTVQLVIGGTPQGVAQAVTLTGTLANTLDVNDVAAWNVDRTAAELNGAQIQIVTTQSGMPTDDAWYVDAIELVITYDKFIPGFPDELLTRYHNDPTHLRM